ncbi:hypothetical protein C8R46DRAFT_1035138 [Mycena filopes]|nr:hypothetical protein C8R46DRAFT_1035138 [Mycena filopes]
MRCGRQIGLERTCTEAVKTSKNKKIPTFKAVFNQESLDPPAPTLSRITAFYSARCYAERIKPHFEARWAAVSKQVLPPGVKGLAAITVQNIVIKEAWESESLAFQNEMRAAQRAEFDAGTESYKTVVAGEAPKTPEEFQTALDNAGYYLQPFIDAAAERFGMNVSLLMCGPTPARGGAIEVHSVHTGVSKGMVPRIWPEYDRAGFAALRRSFRNFSEHCYSIEDKRARSLGGIPEALHVDTAVVAATAVSGTEGGVASGSGGGSNAALSRGGEDGEDGNGDRDGNGDDGNGDGNDDDRDGDGGKGGEDSDEEEGPEFNRDPKTAICPELWAEMARMPRQNREKMIRRVRWSMPDYELLCENNRARNLQLMRDVVGAGGASAQVGISGGQNAGTKERAKKKKTVAASTEPPRRSPRGGIVVGGEEEGQGGNPAATANGRPRATAAYKGAAAEVPLVRPEDDARSLGPFMDGARPPAPATVVLVRPEDDPTTEGPLLPAETPADVVLVRPEDDPSAEGPLLPKALPYKDEVTDWGATDADKWTEELRVAVRAFGRVRALGGEDWVKCVDALLAVERAWGFAKKGLWAAPGEDKGRPKVVAWFFRWARKWENHVELQTAAVGPRAVEGSFASAWWDWWCVWQPKERKTTANGTLARTALKGKEVWEEMAKTSGKNGLLLVVGCLLWWGEAVATQEDNAALVEDWKEAVKDVVWVLSNVGKVVGAVVKKVGAESGATTAKGPARVSKRKGDEKENEGDEAGERPKRWANGPRGLDALAEGAEAMQNAGRSPVSSGNESDEEHDSEAFTFEGASG